MATSTAQPQPQLGRCGLCFEWNCIATQELIASHWDARSKDFPPSPRLLVSRAPSEVSRLIGRERSVMRLGLGCLTPSKSLSVRFKVLTTAAPRDQFGNAMAHGEHLRYCTVSDLGVDGAVHSED
jgi:hypothetical protein